MDEIEELREKLKNLEEKEEKRKQKKLVFTRISGTLIANFIFGPRLKYSFDKFIREFKDNGEITSETTSEILANVTRRVISVGIIGLIIAIVPLALLFQQNKLIGKQTDQIKIQNMLFEKQHEMTSVQIDLLKEQSELTNASTVSSQITLLGDLLKDLSSYLDKHVSPKRTLSMELTARLITLSQGFEPYVQLKDGKLVRPLSPERGQLLLYLLESKIDTSFLKYEIFPKANFSYANMEDLYLKDVFLSGAYLNFSSFNNSVIDKSKFTWSLLKNTSFDNSEIRGSNFHGSQLHNTDFDSAAITYSNFNYTYLDSSSFYNAKMLRVDFIGASIIDTDFCDASFSFFNAPDFDRCIVNDRFWPELMGNNGDLEWAEFFIEYHRIKDVGYGKYRVTACDLDEVKRPNANAYSDSIYSDGRFDKFRSEDLFDFIQATRAK